MTDEKTELHNEYRRGWVDGVLLPYPLSCAEASESKYPKEYERGLKDGSEALAEALEARWEELSRIVNEESGLPDVTISIQGSTLILPKFVP